MHKLLSFLLKKIGKNYIPDPNIPNSTILIFLIKRFFWLVRGLIFFQKPIFVGKNVVFEKGKHVSFATYVTLDPYVRINAVSTGPVHFGKSVRIGAYSQLLCTAHFSKVGKGFVIGDYSSCGEFCVFGAAGGITIGKHVMIGQYVSFHAQDHLYDDPTMLIQDQGAREQGIVIGDDCWIGAKATFLDGARIGNHCVVAAGAVVKGVFPDHVVIGGVPAKIIKTIGAS